MRMDPVDAQLLSALHAGDEHALEALLSRHAPAVYRFGVQMCRDPEEARDVVQDTLLAAARSLRDFRQASSLTTWFYKVARSFCIKRRRTGKHAPRELLSFERELASEPRSHAVPPDEAAASAQIGTALEHAIRELEPLYREVLLLRDVEGLTAPEVANVLDVSVDAVKSRLHRARAQVRARLEPYFPPAEQAGRTPATRGCPDVVALFSRFTEGEIGTAECAKMQDHVAHCARCSAACDSLKHTLALCRANNGEVPAEVQELVRKALRELAAAQRSR
jgi:RNA polymerase sigma-70 factor (ECF subfamily)